MMDNKTVQKISSGSTQECQEALDQFSLAHEDRKDFKGIDRKTKELLWDGIFSRLKTSDSESLTRACLNTLRILSRDKECLEHVMTEERVKTLLVLSGLKVDGERSKLVEGLKVIFNMIFQSATLRIMLISEGILGDTLTRLEDFVATPKESSEEFQYFVCRILFLITALCHDTAASKVRNLHNGLEVVTSYLESELKILWDSSSHFQVIFADIVCEILKLLYNLVADLTPRNKRMETLECEVDEEDLEALRRITRNVRSVLNQSTWPDASPEVNVALVEQKKYDIRRHAIEVVAAVPAQCFEEFIPLLPAGESAEFLFEDKDTTAVEMTLQHLNESLEAVKRKTMQSDQLAPSLLALHNMVINNRAIRKYLKRRIFPPLTKRDVEQLPEEGTTVRNKLVSLLTSPVAHITDLVANLLFVICKENVGKLVKYTGYGNAAGLLANRGLMLGGRPPRGKYSDSEGDSDTEEYKEVAHMINPVEGRIQVDHPDPMEGMTDEQKEFEAMKLVNAIDKLERTSGIRPCRIGPDGRPEPIEHVLQLQEALENPVRGLQTDRGDSDSDSD